MGGASCWAVAALSLLCHLFDGWDRFKGVFGFLPSLETLSALYIKYIFLIYL
jgi:hypothetical protein